MPNLAVVAPADPGSTTPTAHPDPPVDTNCNGAPKGAVFFWEAGSQGGSSKRLVFGQETYTSPALSKPNAWSCEPGTLWKATFSRFQVLIVDTCQVNAVSSAAVKTALTSA